MFYESHEGFSKFSKTISSAEQLISESTDEVNKIEEKEEWISERSARDGDIEDNGKEKSTEESSPVPSANAALLSFRRSPEFDAQSMTFPPFSRSQRVIVQTLSSSPLLMSRESSSPGLMVSRQVNNTPRVMITEESSSPRVMLYPSQPQLSARHIAFYPQRSAMHPSTQRVVVQQFPRTYPAQPLQFQQPANENYRSIFK